MKLHRLSSYAFGINYRLYGAMVKLMVLACIWFIPNFSFGESNETVKNHLVISSGTRGKPYYKTANEIARIIEESDSTISVSNISSSGSYENFEKLRTGRADLIITQRDVAVEKYYYADTPIKNFEIVIPLFPEMLQIFVRSGEGKLNLTQLKDFLDSKEKIVVGTGPVNTSTYKITKAIFEFLLSDYDNVLFDTRPINESFELFERNEEIDIIAYFAAPPLSFFDQFDSSDAVSIVTIAKKELDPILARYNELETISIAASNYVFNSSEDSSEITSVGTWAFLLSNNITMEVFADRNIDLSTLLIQRFSLSKRTSYSPNYIKLAYESSEFELDRSSLATAVSIDKSGLNMTKFFRGLPMSGELRKVFKDGLHLKPIVILIVVFCIICGLFAYFKWFSENYKLKLLIHQYSLMMLVLVFVVVSLLIFTCVLQTSEQTIFETKNVRSSFLNLTFLDTAKWLLLNVFADHTGNVFPVSELGQLIATIAKYVLVLTSGVMLFVQLLYNYSYKKRRFGTKIEKMSNHIIIVGWNNHMEDILVKYKHAFSSNQVNKQKILLVNNVLESTDELNEVERYNHIAGDIQFLRGDIEDPELIQKVNLKEVKLVLLIAEDKENSSDRNTLLRALAISDFCKDEYDSLDDNIYMIAEVNNMRYKSSLMKAGVNEIVCTSELNNKLLVQASLNKGVAEVVDTLLTYNEGNEFYSMKLEEHSSLHGLRFNELATKLRGVDLTLIGIKIHFTEKIDGGKRVIIDNERIEEHLKNVTKKKSDAGVNKLEKDLIINPKHDSSESNYCVDIDDEIIVLADSMEECLKSLTSLSESMIEKVL